MVSVDELPPPTPAPTSVSEPPAAPTVAPTFIAEAPVFGTTIVVTGDLYDTRLAADSGCDPAGCVPGNIRVSNTCSVCNPGRGRNVRESQARSVEE